MPTTNAVYHTAPHLPHTHTVYATCTMGSVSEWIAGVVDGVTRTEVVAIRSKKRSSFEVGVIDLNASAKTSIAPTRGLKCIFFCVQLRSKLHFLIQGLPE